MGGSISRFNRCLFVKVQRLCSCERDGVEACSSDSGQIQGNCKGESYSSYTWALVRLSLLNNQKVY